ncbi:MAG: ribosome silencing factor [Deltaproteobacteria bacterium]|nr:ribosome silencing factor [Deltaproteobacteria bacterium]
MKESTIETIEKAIAAARAAQAKKAFNLTILNVKGQCSYTDAIVLASSNNERQTKAVAESVQHTLKKELGVEPLSFEGSGGWVILDFGDLVFHAFQDEVRRYYDLEQLWSDAARVPVPATEPITVVEPAPTALARRKKSIGRLATS